MGNIQGLLIASLRADVVLTPHAFEQFDYNLVNAGGSIYVPGAYGHFLKKEGKKTSFLKRSSPAKPTINVSTDYTTITIN